MELHRKDKNWDAYVKAFEDLMDKRDIPRSVEKEVLVDGACLLCSEEEPEHCHRRLIAERIKSEHPDVEVIHLI